MGNGIAEKTVMQLRVARLCLDCEEVHDAQQCPVCASEISAYVSRWVPAPERRTHARPARKAPVLTPPRVAVGCGIAGAVLFGLARWSKAARQRLEASALRDVGELK